jgi:hypothetical protein
MVSGTIKSIKLVMFFVVFSTNYIMASPSNDLKGIWSFEASQAPIEYSKGKLVISEKNGSLEGVMKFGESSRNLVNLKAEGDQLSFGLYLEGELITIKLKFNGRAFTGTATYSAGTVSLTGKKD